MTTRKPCGFLLTGGAGSRMGADKATLDAGGETLAARVARSLAAVAHPVFAVGPAAGTALAAIEDPRQGPLVAVATAWGRVAMRVPVLVVACDLPLVTAGLLQLVAGRLEDFDVALPVLDGQDQTLCACYSPEALDAAGALAAGGERSMRALVAHLTNVCRLPEADWQAIAGREALLDADDPTDWEAAKERLRCLS